MHTPSIQKPCISLRYASPSWKSDSVVRPSGSGGRQAGDLAPFTSALERYLVLQYASTLFRARRLADALLLILHPGMPPGSFVCKAATEASLEVMDAYFHIAILVSPPVDLGSPRSSHSHGLLLIGVAGTRDGRRGREVRDDTRGLEGSQYLAMGS